MSRRRKPKPTTDELPDQIRDAYRRIHGTECTDVEPYRTTVDGHPAVNVALMFSERLTS